MSITTFSNTLLGWPGRLVIRKSQHVVNLVTFSMVALRDWHKRNKIFKTKSYGTSIAQIIFTGVDALPTITILGLATGFVITYRLISIVDSLGATDDAVDILVTAICLGIGPFIAAVILITRTGTAIVVDLGNMKLHGEIEGLEMLGIDINEYIIAPRIIAAAISQLALTVYFTVIALVFGILLSGLLISSSHYSILFDISAAITPYLIMVFVIKNLIFGYVIATIACYNGLLVETSPTEVPQRTTQAIVSSLMTVFIIDGLITLSIL